MTSRTLSGFLTTAGSLIFALGLFSCAHAPVTEGYSSEDLLALACAPGKNVAGVKGTVDMKLASPDASGRFPATVRVNAADGLKVEVNNLIGGVEAVIEVRGGQYSVKVPNHPEKSSSGKGSWGGIPLMWANELFLGRIPCPATSDAGRLNFEIGSESTVGVRVRPGGAKGVEDYYLYRFKSVKGKPWPQSLRWERTVNGRTGGVIFAFDDPDDTSGSPLRWEARSGSGEVKVRWKDRETLR